MRRFALALITCSALLGIASTAHAAPGSLRLSWDICSAGPTDRAVAAGETNIRLVASVTGQSDSVKAYEVWFVYGDASHLVPDAWRFDPAGCQADVHPVFKQLAPLALAKACPSFQNAGGPSSGFANGDISIAGPTLGVPQTLMRVAFVNALPQAMAPNPALTYFVMDVEFDQSLGVTGPTTAGSTCGGLEDGVCFNIYPARCNYLLANGITELPFQVVPGGGMLSANSPGGGCLVTPAQPATWGSIKVQYRE